MHPHILLPMLSVTAILSLESLTARNYSHINETAHISEKCDYTFYQNHPCQITYLRPTVDFIFYLWNLCVQLTQSFFFFFSFFPFPFPFIFRFVTIRKDSNRFSGAGISVLPLPMLFPFIFTLRCMQSEKSKALTRVTYVNWCSMGFF